MDKLDKWTLFAIAVLIISATGLIVKQENSPHRTIAEQRRTEKTAGSFFNADLEKKEKRAHQLLENNNLAQLHIILSQAIKQYPYEGKLYMLRGDMLMRRQRPVAAMLSYRTAVDLNPDFLDKKTALFQGKKIKVATEAAMAAIKAGLAKNPDDAKLKKDRKVFYYMQRKLAGGCG